MTQVILNGSSLGLISHVNLSTFLRVTRMVVVSRTETTICLKKGMSNA